jgi:hypothetical protein
LLYSRIGEGVPERLQVGEPNQPSDVWQGLVTKFCVGDV